MRKVKIGVVGCGDVAFRSYLPDIASLTKEKIDLVGVCDIAEERARKAAKEFKAKEYYLNYNEMLKKADIEVVINLTDMLHHAPFSLLAIKAGKHVYTEKPMAATLEEADTLIGEAAKAGIKIASAPPVMLSLAVQQAKRIINKGSIGKVCFVCAHSSSAGPASWKEYSSDPTWFYKKGAGPLFDLAVYSLHAITGILGPVKKVTAFSGIAIPERIIGGGAAVGKTIKVEVDDNTLMLLDFGDITFACIDGTFCMQASKSPDIEFFGSEGTVTLNPYYYGEGPPVGLYAKKKESDLKGWSTPVAAQAEETYSLGDGIEHLVDCITQDKGPIISAEHGRHVLEIIVKAYESAKSGQVQKLTTTF